MFLRYNLFGLIWALIILLFTLMPGEDMPNLSMWDLISFDTFAHMAVFAVQVFLLIIGFIKQYRFQFFRENPVFLALTLSVTYGVLIEFLQSLVPGRSLELSDIIADTAGCLVGWLLFYIIYKA